MVNMIATVVEQANLASDLFASFGPATQSLPSLGEILGSRRALKRACPYSLARERAASRSAKQLADSLPMLGIGQGEALVRETLRSTRIFEEITPGRWRVGMRAARSN